MGFSSEIAEKALVDCGRCCVICHKFCGSKIELHHIKQVADGGEDSYGNCIPLCFDCHADVKAYNNKHPKGKKYTESELIKHRDGWYKKQVISLGIDQHSKQKVDFDIEVFNEIRAVLSDENVPFLFHYDYYQEYEDNAIHSLNKFIDRCYDPSFEFFDADMEAQKSKLLKDINAFLYLIYANTSSVDGTRVLDGDIDIKVGNKIHNASLTVKASFDDLIKLGRRKYI